MRDLEPYICRYAGRVSEGAGGWLGADVGLHIDLYVCVCVSVHDMRGREIDEKFRYLTNKYIH